MKKELIISVIVFISLNEIFCSEKFDTKTELHNQLAVHSTEIPSQIEIGGPFVGIEMHNSSPLLNRISFYYPLANSIDLSEDYWKRDQYRVMFLGLKIGDSSKDWLGLESYPYILTPYAVSFSKKDDEKNISIHYHFCKDKPAMVAIYEFTNVSAQSLPFEVYTHLETSLKTCHTYNLKNKAWTEYDSVGSVIFTNFEDNETGRAQLFLANAGEIPQSFTTRSNTIGIPMKGTNWWHDQLSSLPAEIIQQSYPDRPVAAYVYSRILEPQQTMRIVQIIGSCHADEGKELVTYLMDNYQHEIEAYENYVLNKAFQETRLQTNDPILDHSIHWAKAILATNAHFLDGDIVPMPCPAQYNFYFTHDALLTDLAAVNFDIARVKQDLKYIVNHANQDNVIPHAYYWKDTRYATEYAESDNWNHFWFIQLAASYLRHSNDVETLIKLYPYISRSVTLTLTNKKDDDLFYAYRPDWWDIGRSPGPRSYMTILAIRALRDYIFISTSLGKNTDELLHLEKMADDMQRQLVERLWDDNLNYLINYFEDGSKDEHIYIGSLLANHFDLLSDDKKRALVHTAQQKLLDERIGIYNVFPMDFHLLIDYLKFNGNEAGYPGYYGNGGIWPHGNAWYALALLAIGEGEQALQFIRNIMTVYGTMNSPHGQPAMYEYRNSAKLDENAYGKVDKPQFLWAGGWYLYCLYNVLGVQESEWNVRFDPHGLQNVNETTFDLYVKGNKVAVNVRGNGNFIEEFKINGAVVPSTIVPQNASMVRTIDVVLGKPRLPIITGTNSILISSHYDRTANTLTAQLKAFPGHRNNMNIASPWEMKAIEIKDQTVTPTWHTEKVDEGYRISSDFIHQHDEEIIVIQF